MEVGSNQRLPGSFLGETGPAAKLDTAMLMDSAPGTARSNRKEVSMTGRGHDWELAMVGDPSCH